jgi:hypothetical protein
MHGRSGGSSMSAAAACRTSTRMSAGCWGG